MIKEQLTIIGEELNYSIPRVKELMDSVAAISKREKTETIKQLKQ